MKVHKPMYSMEEVSQALNEHRVIVADYPYRPRARKYEDTAPGRLFSNLLKARTALYQDALSGIKIYNDNLTKIRLVTEIDDPEPCWRNGMLPGLDAMYLYWLIRTMRPKCYLEIGSGNSTKFAHRAIRDGKLPTKIVSIDPHPRAVIDNLCDTIIRTPHEDVDGSFYGEFLTSGDVVFVDNSHRSFQSSDVTVFFTEMLPVLPRGVYYGIHDIFIPYDYPGEWRSRFYNEQYLLLAYLLGGADGDEIIFPGAYVSAASELRPAIDEIFSAPQFSNVERHAGAFWMQRVGGRMIDGVESGR